MHDTHHICQSILFICRRDLWLRLLEVNSFLKRDDCHFSGSLFFSFLQFSGDLNQRSNYSLKQSRVFTWLIVGCVLIVVMVVVGGITRLTQSGLSMVKWEPIMGALPPLSEQEWKEAFDQYKQTPEFRVYNSDFSLTSFKSIFFWEYIHRLFARITGLVFLIPCVVFWFRGYFSKSLKKQVLLIFGIGIFQGVLGWIMVSSGLVDQPNVSHYRLAAHLTTALGLLMYVYWVALKLKYKVPASDGNRLFVPLVIFTSIVFAQIIFGAFVAGLKAGLMYNTFPKMGGYWIPPDLKYIWARDGVQSLISTGPFVQLIHRTLAFVILIVFAVIWHRSKNICLTRAQRLGLKMIGAAIVVQILLGVLTLLYAVPTTLGATHQFGAILLLLVATYSICAVKSTR